jgi:hypothetical protein
MIGLREDQRVRAELVVRINQLFCVARALAPVGLQGRFAPKREQAPSPH